MSVSSSHSDCEPRVGRRSAAASAVSAIRARGTAALSRLSFPAGVEGCRLLALVERRVGRVRRRCDDVVSPCSAVGPGLEDEGLLARGRLGQGRGERVARAHDDATRERGRGLGRVEPEQEAARIRRQSEVDRARVELDAPRVAEAAGIGRGELELEVGGILVIRCGEGAAVNPQPRLDRVRVAVAAGSGGGSATTRGWRRAGCPPGGRWPSRGTRSGRRRARWCRVRGAQSSPSAAVLPIVIVTVSVAVAPRASVTRRLAAHGAGGGVGPATASPTWSRHRRRRRRGPRRSSGASPSGSLEPVASKPTCSGAAPVVGGGAGDGGGGLVGRACS